MGRIPMRKENIVVCHWNDIDGEDWWKYTSLLRASGDLDILIHIVLPHIRLGHRCTHTPMKDLFAFIFGVRDTFVHRQRQFRKLPRKKNKREAKARAIEHTRKTFQKFVTVWIVLNYSLKLCPERQSYNTIPDYVAVSSRKKNLLHPVGIQNGWKLWIRVRLISNGSRKCVS